MKTTVTVITPKPVDPKVVITLTMSKQQAANLGQFFNTTVVHQILYSLGFASNELNNISNEILKKDHDSCAIKSPEEITRLIVDKSEMWQRF